MDEKECKVRKVWERKRVQNVKIEKERPNQFWNLKNSKFNPLPGNLMNLHHYSTLKNFWVIIFQITIAITLTYIALRWVGNQLTPSMRKPQLSLEWKNENGNCKSVPVQNVFVQKIILQTNFIWYEIKHHIAPSQKFHESKLTHCFRNSREWKWEIIKS